MDEQAKSKKILDLFKQLEEVGIKIMPVDAEGRNKTLADIGNAPDIAQLSIEDRLRQLGPTARADDWWVRGGWKMSF